MNEKIREFFRPTKRKLLFTFLLAVAMIVEFFLLTFINSSICPNIELGDTTITSYSLILAILHYTFYIPEILITYPSIVTAVGYILSISLVVIYSYLLICLFSNVYKYFRGKVSKIFILAILLMLFLPIPITEHHRPCRIEPMRMDKMLQNFNIPQAYECESNKICFELRAYTRNSMDMPVNDSAISVFIDNKPKALGYWDGGTVGIACKSGVQLSPKESCFGYVNVSSCKPGENHSLKVAHKWRGGGPGITVECGLPKQKNHEN